MNLKPILINAVLLPTVLIVACIPRPTISDNNASESQAGALRQPEAFSTRNSQLDCEVLRASLSELASSEQLVCVPGAILHKSPIVLDTQTPSFSGYLAYQLDDELNANSRSAPSETLCDLRRRNKGTVSLECSNIASSSITIAKLDSTTGWTLDSFERRFPNSRGFVAAWLPGYSADRNAAIVRLWIGPWEHGASATYLLERQGASWRIKWRFFSYYA